MARINDGTFVDFKDGDKMTSDLYEQDRRILQVAINDNDSRIGTLTTGQNGLSSRMLSAETTIINHENRVVSLEGNNITQDLKLGDLESSVYGSLAPSTFNGLNQMDMTFDQMRIGYVENKLNPIRVQTNGVGINPESFGLSESATDNYQAMIDTFNHISTMRNGKGRILFPAGKVFKFTRPIGIQYLSNITIDLNGSTLDFSTVPASNTESWLQFNGSVGNPISLTSDAAEDSKTVMCATSEFKVGDMVKVYSNKIWDSTRTSTRVGEICFVEKIDSASQLTLTTPLNDTYRVSDSATIQKLNPIENITLINGKVIGAAGNNEMRGFRITRGINCLVQNIRSQGFDVNHMQFTDCVRTTIHGCFFQEANHSQMGYGVSFADASQDCIASNNHFTDVRHSLSTNNNTTTSWGITRRILFIGNTVTDSAPTLGGTGGDAIDSHAGAEDIFILNNLVFSASGVGINVEANRASIKGNRIKTTASVGIQWLPYADGRKSSINIVGNEVTHVGDGVGTDYGILCFARVADCKNAIIAHNEISSANAGVRFTVSNGYRFKKGVIAGNTVEVKTSGYGLDINGSDFISVNGNSLDVPNYGIGLTDVYNSTVTSTSVVISATSGHGIRLLGTSKRNTITGNAIKGVSTMSATSYGVKAEDTATYNGIFNNVTENMTGGAYLLGAGVGNVQANNI